MGFFSKLFKPLPPRNPYCDEPFDYCGNDDETVQRKAKDFNCDIVHTAPNLLLLDLDNMESQMVFGAMRRYVEQQHPFESIETYRSRGGNVHTIITLKEPIDDVMTRIALQLVLGSDRKREHLSIRRVVKRSKDGEPTCLPKNISLLFRPRTG
jgi:hypothetical protein